MSLRTLLPLGAVVGLFAFLLSAQPAVSAAGGPALESDGPLTFGSNNVLFIADNAGAKIVALELGDLASSGTPGTKDALGIEQKIAALLGTDAREIQINDLAISPTSRNAIISGRWCTSTVFDVSIPDTLASSTATVAQFTDEFESASEVQNEIPRRELGTVRTSSRTAR